MIVSTAESLEDLTTHREKLAVFEKKMEHKIKNALELLRLKVLDDISGFDATTGMTLHVLVEKGEFEWMAWEAGCLHSFAEEVFTACLKDAMRTEPRP